MTFYTNPHRLAHFGVAKFYEICPKSREDPAVPCIQKRYFFARVLIAKRLFFTIPAFDQKSCRLRSDNRLIGDFGMTLGDVRRVLAQGRNRLHERKIEVIRDTLPS